MNKKDITLVAHIWYGSALIDFSTNYTNYIWFDILINVCVFVWVFLLLFYTKASETSSFTSTRSMLFQIIFSLYLIPVFFRPENLEVASQLDIDGYYSFTRQMMKRNREHGFEIHESGTWPWDTLGDWAHSTAEVWWNELLLLSTISTISRRLSLAIIGRELRKSMLTIDMTTFMD